MKTKLLTFLNEFIASPKSEKSNALLSEYIEYKTQTLLNEVEYRRGIVPHTENEVYTDTFTSSVLNKPVKVLTKYTQEVEYASTRETRYEPSDTEIMHYGKITEFDVDLEFNGKNEELVIDGHLEHFDNPEYLKTYLTNIVNSDPDGSFFGYNAKNFPAQAFTPLLIQVIQRLKSFENQDA